MFVTHAHARQQPRRQRSHQHQTDDRVRQTQRPQIRRAFIDPAPKQRTQQRQDHQGQIRRMHHGENPRRRHNRQSALFIRRAGTVAENNSHSPMPMSFIALMASSSDIVRKLYDCTPMRTPFTLDEISAKAAIVSGSPAMAIFPNSLLENMDSVPLVHWG